MSPQAKEVATVVKLVRICWLAPIVFWLGYQARKTAQNQTSVNAKKVSLVPWFLVMFVVFATVSSLEILPEEGFLAVSYWNTGFKWLMCVGMAGVGLQTNLRELLRAGPRPVLVGALQWILLSGVSLAAIYWII